MLYCVLMERMTKTQQTPFGVPGIEYKRGKTRTATPYRYRVVVGGAARLFSKRVAAKAYAAECCAIAEEYGPLSNTWAPLP